MDNLSQFFGEAGFDAASLPPMDDYTPLVPGKYICQITGAEIKQTKTRTGHGLTFSLTVLDGPHAGRKVFDFINIDNPNSICQEIGRRVLAALVLASGLQRLGPVAELNGKVVVAHVKVGKDQNGNDRNNVRTYSAPGAVATAPVAAPVVTPQPYPTPAPVPGPLPSGPVPMDPAVHSQTPGYYTPQPVSAATAVPPAHQFPSSAPPQTVALAAAPAPGVMTPAPVAPVAVAPVDSVIPQNKPWNQG